MPEPLHCPICHGVGKHADRCSGREPEKAPVEQKSKLEQTVNEWADGIADSIPKPRLVGTQPGIDVRATDGTKLVGPNGESARMPTKIVSEESGAQQLWSEKRAKQPCKSCEAYNPEAFQTDDQNKLTAFLIREAHWTPDAVKVILADPKGWRAYGVCSAWTPDPEHLHICHENASCLRLYRPRKGWLKSFGSAIFGGSKRHGF